MIITQTTKPHGAGSRNLGAHARKTDPGIKSLRLCLPSAGLYLQTGLIFYKLEFVALFTVNLKQYFNTEFVPLRFIINVGAYVSSHAKKCRLVAQLFLPEYRSKHSSAGCSSCESLAIKHHLCNGN